jgi:hypothetical protein
MTDKTKRVRGPRKTSPRTKGSHPKPGASSKLKEMWANPDKYPEFHEKMRLRNEKREQMRRDDPTKFTRQGVPDGMRKRDAVVQWERANALADRFIKIMQDKGELPSVEVDAEVMDEIRANVVVPDNDAAMATEALREAFVLAVGPSNMKIKIQAINTVLNFTKSKPESKSKLTLDKAEDFLTLVASDNKPYDGAE